MRKTLFDTDMYVMMRSVVDFVRMCWSLWTVAVMVF